MPSNNTYTYLEYVQSPFYHTQSFSEWLINQPGFGQPQATDMPEPTTNQSENYTSEQKSEWQYYVTTYYPDLQSIVIQETRYPIHDSIIQWYLGHPAGNHGFPLEAPTFVDQAQEQEVPIKKKKVSGKNYNNTIKDYFGKSETPKGKIGLEIECEGERLNTSPMMFWNAKLDGSLRPYKGHQPIEYVLYDPVSRDDLDKALTYLESFLKNTSSRVVDSPRTSVHVHLNQATKTWKQVLTFLSVYLILEDILVEYSGPDRVGNLFCLRVRDAEHFIYLLEESIKEDYYTDLVNSEMRYTSCNVAALYKFGSLEFRTLKGTVDKSIILKWVDILLDLENTAGTFKDPQAVVEFAEYQLQNHRDQQLIKTLLPNTWMYGNFISAPDLHNILWKAVRTVRDIAWATPKWIDTKKELKTSYEKKKGFNPSTYVNASAPNSIINSNAPTPPPLVTEEEEYMPDDHDYDGDPDD